MTGRDWPQRDPTTWYGSASWAKRRAHQQRVVQPLCEECLAVGKVTVAVVADHHPPHGNDWWAFRFDPCGRCASNITTTAQDSSSGAVTGGTSALTAGRLTQLILFTLFG